MGPGSAPVGHGRTCRLCLLGTRILKFQHGEPIRVIVEWDREQLDQEIESLLERARLGDSQAFTGLFRLLAKRVAGYVRSQGVSDVDDVVNEVFLGAFRNLESFSGGGAGFRSWLFTIAHHKSMDWLRSKSRSPQLIEAPVMAASDHCGGDAEHDALVALSQENVERLLSMLTDDQRRVVTLRVIADMSLEQVAEVLGKSVGAVKSTLHRAILTLQRRILAEPVSL